MRVRISLNFSILILAEYVNHLFNLSVESYWSLNCETDVYMDKTTKLVFLHV